MNREINNKARLFIIGASGHGKVVAEIARLNKYKEIVFLDDNDKLAECTGYPVIGKTDYPVPPGCHVFIAVGSANIRERISEQYSEDCMPVLIHPDAVISDRSTIGPGSVVMAGAIINTDSVIGKGCIINTASSVDHDCVLGDFVHNAVGAHICGTVKIGNRTWIGAGATVINNVNIAPDCIIGAGSVVTKDITKTGIYIGVPATKLKQEDEK